MSHISNLKKKYLLSCNKKKKPVPRVVQLKSLLHWNIEDLLTILWPVISVCVHHLSAFCTISITNATTIICKSRFNPKITPNRLPK